MKKTEYFAPAAESIDFAPAEMLCQSQTSFGGSTGNYGEDNDDIF